ncbi:glycoside hydrolase family 125 protein [Pontibacter qinzhouensis]|uniref:Glycoside hydrolase family 125 protein n=1 Tax=Pontibacter qinzhouensis TaxID=2603253 RepID=A0A5C8JKU9_9BACT|nr:glycoside hydrolase family 125 protein [Pontibacter qinzhouensis]TXK37666.1 glycoside hydrolase family 125 protein [Pontibacter qinzhouensis]
MTTRRNFIKATGLAVAGVASGFTAVPSYVVADPFATKRPAPANRNFTSKAVEKTIKDVKKKIADKELAWLFENCLPNTLDTTVHYQVLDGKPDTFVITGDIEAMWLRDSTAQVWPYLPLANEDKQLQDMLAGVINRQVKCILIDPYANAFNMGATGSEWEKDLTDMKPELHERKWEIDSLCYPIRLAYGYWKTTGDTSCFDGNWAKAMALTLKTFQEQQRKEGSGPYSFQRVTEKQTDTVAGAGFGYPINPVGLICSTFRPSDDATIYLFLVPSNYFAVVSLRQLAEMSQAILKDAAFARQCTSLADEVEQALEKYAVAEHLDFGKVFPFEVDGFGNKLFMDDANVPSLLGLPYLGVMPATDPVYQNTRKFVLSTNNPFFYKGKAGEGIGGPHVGVEMIWPMSIIMRALTSSSDAEIKDCLRILKTTHAGTGFMHETFHKDDATKFTRKWFAWANTLFGELILKLHKERPHLLRA